MTDKEQFLYVCRIVYLTLVLIFVVYMFIDFYFCTSKSVYVSTSTNICYQRRTTKSGQTFWRPVKKFLFKNVFRYLLADDKLVVPDLIPYKEWLKQNDE